MSFEPRVDLTAQPQDRRLKPNDRKMMAAVREFESLMLHQLIKTMRQTVKPVGGNGGAMGTYRDMMDEQLARSLAQSGGLGLADVLARQMLENGPLKPGTDEKPGDSGAERPAER